MVAWGPFDMHGVGYMYVIVRSEVEHLQQLASTVFCNSQDD